MEERQLSYEDYKSFWKDNPNFRSHDWGYDEAKEFAQYFHTKGFEKGILAGQKSSIKWIDVKEQLPPMNEEVIVLTDIINGKKVDGANQICFGHIVDTRYAKDYNGWNIDGVHHWIPCPEIPE